VAELAMILASSIAKRAARAFSSQRTAGMCSTSSSGGGEFIYILLFLERGGRVGPVLGCG
jgi:hypothetical protein